MHTPHQIRLNGPWEAFQNPDDPSGVRIHLPKAWSDLADQGYRRMRRWMHRPTGLEDARRIEFAFENIPCSAQVRLNGTALGRIEPQDWQTIEITQPLPDRFALELAEIGFANAATTNSSPQISLQIHR